MAACNKESQIAVLIKQKNNLDAQFEDVIAAQKKPQSSRRGSARTAKKRPDSAAKLGNRSDSPSKFAATPSTQMGTNLKTGELNRQEKKT